MAKTAKATTPEEVWQLLREVGEAQKENSRLIKELRDSQKENARQFKATDHQFKVTDRQLKELQKENAREFKETDKRMKMLQNLFTGQWGKLMESLVEGDLINLLKARGIAVQYVMSRLHGETNGHNWEIDLVAVNRDEIVVVEVKTVLKVGDVKTFLREKLRHVRTYLTKYQDCRIYGAVAYLKAEEEASLYAQKQGLFVIRATGSSASIVNPQAFRPKAF